MRMRWLLCGVLCLLATTPTARAGLYIPERATPWPLPANVAKYRLNLREVLNVAAAQTAVKKLEASRRRGGLCIADRINLGGYYLILRDYNQAIDVLTPALAQEPRNFMVLANLANAYQGLGEFRRAAEFQTQVLSNWPRQFVGWSAEQLWWYRRVEKYHLNLLELRNRQKLLKKPSNTLDNLFPVATLEDPRAPYTIGGMDLKVRDKLPPDVLAIVEQLLLWLPHDERLYWMFGELLNAQAEVSLAADVLQYAENTLRLGNRTLHRHRQLLDDAVRFNAAFKPLWRRALLFGLTPRATFAFPISAAVERQIALTGEGWDEQSSFSPDPTKERQKETPSGPVQDTPTGRGTDTWVSEWRQLGVGFGSGLLVGMLLLLQIGQLRRRFSGSHLPRSSG